MAPEYGRSRLFNDLGMPFTAAPLLLRSLRSSAAVASLTLPEPYSHFCAMLFLVVSPFLGGDLQGSQCKCGGDRGDEGHVHEGVRVQVWDCEFIS